MTQPHYIDRDCQKCGGEIQGWTCQGCGQVFRENDAGALVFSPMEAVAWREKAQIVTEWLAIARETPPTLHSSLNYVPISPSEIDAIAALIPTPEDGRTK